MSLTDIPLLNQIKGRMSWLGDRQRVIAQNVANSDTPGYVARDLKVPASFEKVLNQSNSSTRMMATNAMHYSPNPPKGGVNAVRTPDSETTLDGNSVVVEEQMLKMAESRMAYDTAISFYTKSMQMIRLAAKRPGS